jgi:hypothetical protein
VVENSKAQKSEEKVNKFQAVRHRIVISGREERVFSHQSLGVSQEEVQKKPQLGLLNKHTRSIDQERMIHVVTDCGPNPNPGQAG